MALDMISFCGEMGRNLSSEVNIIYQHLEMLVSHNQFFSVLYFVFNEWKSGRSSVSVSDKPLQLQCYLQVSKYIQVGIQHTVKKVNVTVFQYFAEMSDQGLFKSTHLTVPLIYVFDQARKLEVSLAFICIRREFSNTNKFHQLPLFPGRFPEYQQIHMDENFSALNQSGIFLLT